MVRSMTGYGRGEAADETLSITVELKSVNHRFFECSIRSPRQFSCFEDKLKSYFQSRIARGKVDVFVSCDFGASSPDKLVINEEFANDYIAALRALQKKYRLKNDISVMNVARNDGIFTVTKQRLDEEKAWEVLSRAAETAVDAFISARETEGKRLTDDVLSRADNILSKVALVEERSPETERLYRERIEKKIADLLGNADIDKTRIITETAIFADHIAVSEETVRLRSHIAHLKDLFNEGGVIGKKIDFIVQEMNRETNTIGSKCQDIEISKTVVDMKSEIEKIREQIQNIE
ncbi:MAG: YicC family protein [Ruminococcaceae bacterium]|nr:YicC family protein [Oscillospiraceae bacterium]